MEPTESMDHDQRFKNLLEKCLGPFYRVFFTWADLFDWNQPIEWLRNEVFLDPPTGERRRMHLVAKVALKTPETHARSPDGIANAMLIHIEVESRDGAANIAERMYEYYGSLRRHQLPILPVVLLLNVAKQGIGEEVFHERAGSQVVLTFRCDRVGLPGLHASRYLYHQERLASALCVLMRPDRPLAELAVEAMRHILDGPDDMVTKYFLIEMINAYAPFDQEEYQRYLALLETNTYGDLNAVNKTMFERGQQSVVFEQLQEKFGSISASTKAKLESLPSSEVHRLARKLLTANSLAELGLATADEAVNNT